MSIFGNHVSIRLLLKRRFLGRPRTIEKEAQRRGCLSASFSFGAENGSTKHIREDAATTVLEDARSDAHCVRCAGCNTLPQERLKPKRLSNSQRNSRH